MIPFGSQRGNGSDLARHLSNGVDNEFVEFAELRGSLADDLAGAFAEWEVQAATLTRAKNYLYSLSINPDERQGRLTREQYHDFINRVEGGLGLNEQPRAVVYHLKEDKAGLLREHCHVVWSRINMEAGRAIPISWDHYNLADITREFAADHNLKLPDGYYDKNKNWSQHTPADAAQRQLDGISPEARRSVVTDLWHTSDSARAFVSGLGSQGYLLAQGRRPYVLVDGYGGTYALPRMIDDKAVGAKAVRDFLQREYPAESLPSVEDALELAASQLEDAGHGQSHDEQRRAEQQDMLHQAHDELRVMLQAELTAMKQEQVVQDATLRERCRADQETLRTTQDEENRLIAGARAERTPTGLAGFLAKASGVSFLLGKLHEYEDRRRASQHLQEHTLQAERDEECQAQQRALHALQAEELARRMRAQEANFVREQQALVRQQEKERAIKTRKNFEHMPPVQPREPIRRKEARNAFARSLDKRNSHDPNDLSHEFDGAASKRAREGSDPESRSPDVPTERDGNDRDGRGR